MGDGWPGWALRCGRLLSLDGVSFWPVSAGWPRGPEAGGCFAPSVPLAGFSGGSLATDPDLWPSPVVVYLVSGERRVLLTTGSRLGLAGPTGGPPHTSTWTGRSGCTSAFTTYRVQTLCLLNQLDLVRNRSP